MLNPSLADNMPNSVLEALACGVPVVTTAVGGIPWLVRHRETALLVPPAQPDAMAAALITLLGDPELAARLRQNGLQLAAHHSWQGVRPALMGVSAAACNKRPPRVNR